MNDYAPSLAPIRHDAPDEIPVLDLSDYRAGLPGARPLVYRESGVQRLKVLVNQMRTNMAFVQSSQTPLKLLILFVTLLVGV